MSSSSIKRNPSFLINIVNAVENQIKRNINIDEENLIIKAIASIQDSIFNNHSIQDVVNLIKKVVVEEITLNHCNINNVNIHEILKNEIDPDKKSEEQLKKLDDEHSTVSTNVDSIFGYSDISTLVKKVNEPISSLNTIQILLDTRYRNLNTDGTTEFTWEHINQLAMSQGTVNSLGNIRDIISITVMPFRIPNVLSEFNDYDLVTLSIEEFISQSIIAHENRRFHFLSCVDRKNSDTRWLSLCYDDYYKAEYKFNKPITTLNTITIKFGSPLSIMTFDKDRLPGDIAYGLQTTINFDEEHNLTDNDLVYINNFITSNPVTDSSVIASMNNTNGNPATVISPTSITIPVDTSTIIGNTIIRLYTVYFGSKRMFIPMELKYLAS